MADSILSRRGFLGSCGALSAAALAPALRASAAPAVARTYHLSTSPQAIRDDPELLDLAHRAGVTDVWLTGFLYGHWLYPVDELPRWLKKIEARGMSAHLINVPLGHPGDSLGARSGDVPLTPPTHWRLAVRPDGTTYAGTSLHVPATEENRAALRKIQAAGVRRAFLDDDFRLARGPGVIGGCFCVEHKRRFLHATGHNENAWQDLIHDRARRELSRIVRDWVEFQCNQLSACFLAQRQAAPSVQLGIMVMYLGSEKAGIRLADYRDVPFRVGELMFNDHAFAPVKGKTDELFSALMHRRFARPELAFSETTAFPADQLSARNMAAKLAVSTIADVRNTMFMSGITAFPREHWQTLGPAMKRHAELHRKIVGHAPRGPLKHYWGEASRFVGDDNPFSLFLALGIPFEVTSTLCKDGFTFLSDADARQLGAARSPGTVLLARPQAGLADSIRPIPESLKDLFAWKQEVLPKLEEVPYVEDQVPVVCTWYPS
ncbi:MAG: hypothetical protein ACP5XB_22665, partial [Isosphaeraceae bacterium]